LGEENIEDATRYFNVKNIIMHPNYTFTSNYDDIALIELDRSAVSNKFVLPACLWPTQNFNFDKLEAAGWGLDAFSK
jgi:Trypsin